MQKRQKTAKKNQKQKPAKLLRKYID